VDNVLGSARTGLIFTGIQEGAQPGRPNLAKQSRVFHTMYRHAGFLLGVSWAAGTLSRLGTAWRWRAVRVALSVPAVCVFSLSVSLLLLFPLIAVLLKCPYPNPSVFCLFLPILLRTLAGAVTTACRFCCQLQISYNKHRNEQSHRRSKMK